MQSRLYPSLKYLSKTYTVGKCHPTVKPYMLSSRDVSRIPVKNKIMTGTFILQSNHAKFNQNDVNPMCHLCHVESETLTHFLLECRILETVRKPILTEFKKVFSDVIAEYPDAARYTLVQLLVDCNVVLQDCPTYVHTKIATLIDLLHYHSRCLVYVLHTTRYCQLPVTAKYIKKRQGTVNHKLMLLIMQWWDI